MKHGEKNNSHRNRTGMLIAFEGIDGVGKTTQLRLLAEALTKMGHNVISTREPTNGPFGQKIRQVLVNRNEVSPEEELELFMADRREHVKKLISPSLSKGKIVITDRYYLSTAAYQGAAGRDEEDILKRNEAFAPIPDLVLLLVGEPSLGIHRIKSFRQEELNDFEQKSNLSKVAAVFDRLKRDYIKRVDARGNIDEIHNAVMEHVKRLLI